MNFGTSSSSASAIIVVIIIIMAAGKQLVDAESDHLSAIQCAVKYPKQRVVSLCIFEALGHGAGQVWKCFTDLILQCD